MDRRAARTVGRPRLTGAGAAGVRRGDRGTQQVGSPDDRSLTDLGASSHASTKQNSAPRIAAFGQLPNGGGNLDCGARPYREGFGGRPARWGFVMSARASELRGPGRRPSRCYDGANARSRGRGEASAGRLAAAQVVRAPGRGRRACRPMRWFMARLRGGGSAGGPAGPPTHRSTRRTTWSRGWPEAHRRVRPGSARSTRHP